MVEVHPIRERNVVQNLVAVPVLGIKPPVAPRAVAIPIEFVPTAIPREGA
jgi:hypothetical protein